MGNVSRSMTSPVVCLITLQASFISDRVLSPRKSILISPVVSMTWPSYWVTAVFRPGKSGSSAVDTGTQLLIGSRQIMKPQAWIPVPRTVPSSILAYLMVLLSRISEENSACCSSGVYLMALVRFIFAPSGSRSGIALQRAFALSSGSFSTRATSLMEFLVAILP